jgi:hypothetical protein
MNTHVAVAPSGWMYYMWNDKKTIFVNVGVTTQSAFEETQKFYKEKVNSSISDLDLLALSHEIRKAPQVVIDFLVQQLIKRITPEDVHIAMQYFDYKSVKHRQVLNDLIYCVNENHKDLKIEFTENINVELNAINSFKLESTWKSEFTKNKAHKKIGKPVGALSFSAIRSFVAGSSTITFRLKNDSFVSFGYGDYEEQYDSMLESYAPSLI